MNTTEELSPGVNSAPFSVSVFRLPLLWLKRQLEAAGVSKIIISLDSGEQFSIGSVSKGTPVAKVNLHRPVALAKSSGAGIIGLAESYMAGDWDSPDLVAVTDWAMANEQRLQSLFAPGWFSRKWQRLFHRLNNNSRRGSRKNIAAHYDLGNNFYQPWLDSTMTYSSALFNSDQENLEQGQHNKYNKVLEWLDVTPEHRVLEIGCGWGGFSRALSGTTGSSYQGITLSTEQLRYAQEQADRLNQKKTQFSLTDYRDIDSRFDRIVSIEMIEAVGEKHWPTYFGKLYDSLKTGGVAVLQVITIDESRYEDYRRGTDFIQRYIFPGGMLPTHQVMQEQIANAGLHLDDSLAFGQDYARTLGIWKKQFNEHWSENKPKGFDQRFHNMWNFYLAYCETGFKCESINVRFYKIRKAGK